MRTRHLLLLLALLPACRTAPEPAGSSAPPSAAASPENLVELLEVYAVRAELNLTFDEATQAQLAAIPVESLGAEGTNLLKIGPAPAPVAAGAQGLADDAVLEVLVLEYADAQDLADTLHDFLLDASAGGEPPVKVTADARTNSLVIYGDYENLAQVKDLVVLLDREQGEG